MLGSAGRAWLGTSSSLGSVTEAEVYSSSESLVDSRSDPSAYASLQNSDYPTSPTVNITPTDNHLGYAPLPSPISQLTPQAVEGGRAGNSMIETSNNDARSDCDAGPNGRPIEDPTPGGGSTQTQPGSRPSRQAIESPDRVNMEFVWSLSQDELSQLGFTAADLLDTWDPEDPTSCLFDPAGENSQAMHNH